MKGIKLTKVEYKERGFYHVFKNHLGEEAWVRTTRDEYERLGKEGGSKYNPTLNGFTWVHSLGETIVVDTPSGRMRENEYCLLGDKYFACLMCSDGILREIDFEKDKIINNTLWQ